MEKIFFAFLFLAVGGLIWTISGCDPGDKIHAGNPSLEQNCTIAESLMTADNYVESEKLLKSNLAITRGHARTLYLLGELYRRRDSIYYRRLSAERLKEAIIQQPQNFEYHLSLGKTYQNQGFYGNAMDEFKKASKLDPQNSEVHRRLAQMYKMIGLRYEDKEYYQNALEQSAMAAAIDKNPLDYCDQANMMIKLDQFDQALNKVDTALTLKPTPEQKKRIFLIKGLCNVMLNDFAAAAFDFDSAIILMNDFERHDYEDIRLVVTPQEYARLQSMSHFDRQKETEKIWRGLDPDLTTSFNERVLEHYARQVYADISFSLPEKTIIGRNTRRGEILIRFGFPELKRYIYGDASAHPPLASSWEWIYTIGGRPFSLRFEDTYHNGNFDFPFVSSIDAMGSIANDPSYVADFLARSIGQKYDFAQTAPPMDFRYEIGQFRGDHDKTDIEIYYNVPYRELNFNQDGDSALGDFKIRAVLTNFDFQPLDSAILKRAAKAPVTLTQSQTLVVSDDFVMRAHADSVLLSLVFTNPNNGHTGRSKQTILLRNFCADKIELSDMILAREAQTTPENAQISRKSTKLTTNLSNRYFISEPVKLYFEFYNLAMGDNQRSHFIIQQTIAHLKKPKIIGQIVGYKVVDEVSTIFEEYGANSFDKRLLTLDFSKFEKGRYRITIVIEDIISGQSTSASEEIILYE